MRFKLASASFEAITFSLAFRWPTSARSGRRGDGRALRAVIRSVAITVRKKRLPYPFPTTH